MKSFLFVLSLMSLTLSAQIPKFEWAKASQGTGFQYAFSSSLDSYGNIYTTGRFEGTVDFDPGSGVFNLTSNGLNDLYVLKLDSNGFFVWVKQIGGIGHDQGSAINIGPNGNIYLNGYFSDIVDFDPGIDTNNIVSNGSADIFVLKLNQNGDFIWVKTMGGPSSDAALYGLEISSNGHLYILGEFEDSVDFDPGNAVTKLISNGYEDLFIQKLDTNGNFNWVRQIGGKYDDTPRSISIDLNENIYTVGLFNDSADLDPGVGTYFLSAINGQYGSFVQKLDSSGSLVWVKQAVNLSTFEKASIDKDGNVLLSGLFADTLFFNPVSGISPLIPKGYDIFIQKLDANGSVMWAKNACSGNGIKHLGYLATGFDGSIYMTGKFKDTVDFNPGTGIFQSYQLIAYGVSDHAFIQKLDSNGDFVWAVQLGGSPAPPGLSEVFGGCIEVDSIDNVYTSGHFLNDNDFDFGIGTYNITSVAGRDFFIHKLSQKVISSIWEQGQDQNQIKIYPNPTNRVFIVHFEKFQKSGTLHVRDLMGREILTRAFYNVSQVNLELEEPDGVYFIEINNEENKRVVKRLVKK